MFNVVISIEERLRALGWSDADLDFLSSSVWSKWRSLLDQSKAITDRGTHDGPRLIRD